MISNVYILCLISTIEVLAAPPLSPTKLRESFSNLLPAPGVCGTDSSFDPIIRSGEITKIDEFPWMALIEYSKPNNSRGFHCGGVLISDRYVLTAAHCATGKSLQKQGWKLSSVRLGEWDTDSEADCNGDYCADLQIDIAVEDAIVNEYYDHNSYARKNDIALLRLSHSVAYTNFIKPICLPTTEYLRKLDYDGIHLDVAGWGKTEHVSFSNFKHNVQVSGESIQRCNTTYSRYGIILGPGQLCAGRTKVADSCRGDSGGPIMAIDSYNSTRTYWYLAGIMSLGPPSWEIEGIPSVYTRVSAFLDWILRNIRT